MQIKLISFPADQMVREVSANLNAVRECLRTFSTLLLEIYEIITIYFIAK